MKNDIIDEQGIRDEYGHWRPSKPLEYAPLFQWPLRPLKALKWFFGCGNYLWPQRTVYLLLTFATWYVLHSADLSIAKTLRFSWIGPMLLRNVVLMLIVYGFYHLTIYVWKFQGTKGKYHPQWQARNSKKFLFRDQVKDNMFRSLVSGVPIWTAWEVLYLWAAANGKMPLLTWSSNPVWFVCLFLLIPLWREFHFYFIHRLIHWKPLLRAIHSVHHKNPNCGPWSGMAMHPVEHVLYLSVVLIHFIVPSHPVHFFFTSQLTALRPAHGHTGFEGPFFKEKWPAGDYFHYLHHKHVSCNYGESVLPLDKLFGSFFNGEGPYSTKERQKKGESGQQ